MDYHCLLEFLYAILVANHICHTETIRILLVTWKALMEALHIIVLKMLLCVMLI